MSIRVVIFLLMLQLPTVIYGQQNYLVYHKKIIQAEKLFLKDSVKASLAAYHNIFKEYSPFAKDAFIALQLACMIKDTSYASTFFEYCFQAGVNWKLFSQIIYIEHILKNDSVYKRRMYSQYIIGRKKYFSKIDTALSRQLYQFTKNDGEAKKQASIARNNYQKWIREQNDSFHTAYDKIIDSLPILRNYRAKNGDSSSAFYQTMKKNVKKMYVPRRREDTFFVAIEEDNIRKLDSISKCLGYVPGEKTIGLIDNENNWRFTEVGTSEMLVPNIIQTFYHHGCGFWMMKDELWESVIRGEIHPRYYAVFYDYSYCDLTDKSYDMSSTNLVELYNIKCDLPAKDKAYKLIKLSTCREEKMSVSQINKCRLDLGIASLDHDKWKKEYEKSHKLKLFFGLLDSEM